MGEETVPLFELGVTLHSDDPQEPKVPQCQGAEPSTSSEVTELETVPKPSSSLVRYERTFIVPVTRLKASLDEVLDVEAHPDREPQEALAALRAAVGTFQADTSEWFD